MKKSKYITFAAALVLGAAPVATTVVTAINSSATQAVNAATTAGTAGLDTVINGAFKADGTQINVSRSSVSSVAAGLVSLFNAGKTNIIPVANNGAAGITVDPDQKAAMEYIYKYMLLDSSKNTVFDMSPATGQPGISSGITAANIVINGKDQTKGDTISVQDIMSAGSLTISFRMFTGSTAGATEYDTPSITLVKTNYDTDLSQIGNVHVYASDTWTLGSSTYEVDTDNSIKGITIKNDDGTIIGSKFPSSVPTGTTPQNIVVVPAGTPASQLNKYNKEWNGTGSNANGLPSDFELDNNVLFQTGAAGSVYNYYKFGVYSDAIDIYVATPTDYVTSTGSPENFIYEKVGENVGRKTNVDVQKSQLPIFEVTAPGASTATQYTDGTTAAAGMSFAQNDISVNTADKLQKSVTDYFLNGAKNSDNTVAANGYKISLAPGDRATTTQARKNGLTISAKDITIDTSAVDTTKAGTYYATVKFAANNTAATNAGVTATSVPYYDNNAQASLKIPVTIVDAGAPVILFDNNGQNQTIKVGEYFNVYQDLKVYPWAGATNWTNQTDSNVTVKVSGEVDTNTPGVYILTYTATNSNGKVTTLTRQITVTGDAAAAPTVTNVSGTVYVNYVPGYGIMVWNNYKGQATGKFLAHGTAWKTYKVATYADGSTWYNVGGDQWVQGKYVQSTPVNGGSDVTANPIGTATIKYVAGYSVNLWADASTSNFTGRRLANGTTWKVFGEKNGFYNVGKNQWISAKYASLN